MISYVMATTKKIILNGAVNEAMAEKLAAETSTFYFDANGLEQQQNICIYLTTHGGLREAENVILNIINSEPERFSLVANGEISSSGFSLFFNAKCKRTIFPYTTGMYHLTRLPIEISLSGKGHFDSDKFHLKHFKKGLKDELIWCEALGMSAKDIERIAKTEDVFFTTKQLQKFLEINEAINREAATGANKSGAVGCVVGKPKFEGGDTVEQLGENNQLLNDDREPQDKVK